MGFVQRIFSRKSDCEIAKEKLRSTMWELSNAKLERDSLMRTVDALSRDISHQELRIKRLENYINCLSK